MAKLDNAPLYLEGELTLRDAASTAERLRAVLTQPGDIVIDASRLADVDISIIQLLVSAQKTAAAQSREFGVVAPAESALQQALRRFGFLSDDGSPRSPDQAFWAAAGGPSKGVSA